MSIIPVTVPTGAIRYNTDSNKMECFNGTKWMQVAVSSPDLDGGARGMFGGGWINSPSTVYTNAIDYITISTAGNAVTFGDLLHKTSYLGGVASRTRGVYVGGSAPESETTQNVMQYVTISSTGDAINFGDLTEQIAAICGHSNETRAVVGSGYNPSPSFASKDTLNYFTIASTGDAIDFGDLPQTRVQCFTFGNSTRGIWGGGYYTGSSGTPGGTQSLVALQLATTGTAFEFGKLNSGAVQEIRRGGLGNSIRGLAAGGSGSEYNNDIDSFNIASLGSAENFGDLLSAVEFMGGVSSPTRGVFGGGSSGPYSANNVMQYVNIATEGNAVDFGDLVDGTRSASPGDLSNAHGGL